MTDLNHCSLTTFEGQGFEIKTAHGYDYVLTSPLAVKATWFLIGFGLSFVSNLKQTPWKSKSTFSTNSA